MALQCGVCRRLKEKRKLRPTNTTTSKKICVSCLLKEWYKNSNKWPIQKTTTKKKSLNSYLGPTVESKTRSGTLITRATDENGSLDISSTSLPSNIAESENRQKRQTTKKKKSHENGTLEVSSTSLPSNSAETEIPQKRQTTKEKKSDGTREKIPLRPRLQRKAKLN